MLCIIFYKYIIDSMINIIYSRILNNKHWWLIIIIEETVIFFKYNSVLHFNNFIENKLYYIVKYFLPHNS